jgi:insecticidal toxin complex protein TccC
MRRINMPGARKLKAAFLQKRLYKVSPRLSRVRYEAIRPESHVNVEPVGDTGIVHVQIKGDANTFQSVGIDNMNTGNGPKELHYLSVPSERFQGHVLGGNKTYWDKDLPGTYVPNDYAQQLLVSRSVPEAKSHAFINGSFFNVANRANKHLPVYTPIGDTATPGGEEVTSIPPPSGFHDDYIATTFNDGSKITTAPILSDRGVPTFPHEKLNSPKYQYQGSDRDKPGVLKHAAHPNPRSGVSLPGAISSGNAYRLAAGFTPSTEQFGSQSSGFTMPEWSTTMARLDRLNQTPGGSLNLDGGSSTALGVVNSNGEKLFDKRQNDQQSAPTRVSFSSATETTSDENLPVTGERERPR